MNFYALESEFRQRIDKGRLLKQFTSRPSYTISPVTQKIWDSESESRLKTGTTQIRCLILFE